MSQRDKTLILLLEPSASSYYIVGKTINYLKKIDKNKRFIIVGDKKQFKSEFKKFLYEIKYINEKIPEKKIGIYQVKFKTKKQHFQNVFDVALSNLKNGKVKNFINLPIDKKILPKKFVGFTEFYSNKIGKKDTETMLLYSKKFSVSPITTHVEIRKVSNLITKRKIINNVNNIKLFYKKYLNKNVNVLITGLNPHSGKDMGNRTIESKIIIPAIRLLKKKHTNVFGPYSADSIFNYVKDTKKPFCIVGMYHDQVLPIFKTINKFDGVNLTIGLKYLRGSPDHGTAPNIKNFNKLKNDSLKYCIKFFYEN